MLFLTLLIGILCCVDLISAACSSVHCDQLQGYCLETSNSSNNNSCTCLGVIDCTYPITDCSCSVDGNPCYNGECVDLEEGYMCNCSHGWSGQYCHIDDDFCHVNTAYCKNGQCIEGVGPKVYCNCSDNYRGETCDEIFCTDDYCNNGGTCQVTGNNLTCECKIGYYGDQCENEVVKCTKEDCESISGACYSDDEGNDCICFGVLDCTTPITHCSMADPYLSCLHGGVCINETNDSIACTCVHNGLEGDHCEKSIEFCKLIDCSGHGQCIEGLGADYTCECDELYKGDLCDTCYCPVDYCKNGGTCSVTGGIPCVGCNCMPGYTGDNCEIDNIYICNGNITCNNNGHCIDLGGFYFECVCDYGFTGETCADKLSFCELSPCLNNGTCNDSHCICQEDFGGNYCEIDLIDMCALNVTCLNGGTCVDGPGSTYKCICPNGYNGTNCEVDLEYCDYLKEPVCGGCQESFGNSVICSNCSKICNCKVCACVPSYCYNKEEMYANIFCEYTVQSSLESIPVTISCSCPGLISTITMNPSETISLSQSPPLSSPLPTAIPTSISSPSSSLDSSPSLMSSPSVSSPTPSSSDSPLPPPMTTNHVDSLFEGLIMSIIACICLFVTVITLLLLIICTRSILARSNPASPRTNTTSHTSLRLREDFQSMNY